MSNTKEKAPISWHSPVSLHAFIKTLKRDILEAYKVRDDCFEDSESDSHDKNDIKGKVNVLVRLHKAMQDRCLKRKTMLVWVKEYINKNLATWKSLYNMQELYNAFKEKTMINIGFLKFCALKTKWCVLAGLKMTHSVFVWSAHENVMLIVDAMDWGLTYKDLIKKIVYTPESNKCIMDWCESCPSTTSLKEFLDQELNEHEDD